MTKFSTGRSLTGRSFRIYSVKYSVIRIYDKDMRTKECLVVSRRDLDLDEFAVASLHTFSSEWKLSIRILPILKYEQRSWGKALYYFYLLVGGLRYSTYSDI